ncbi:two-component system sensor histidine kinase KdpD [Arcanobacterium pluranimalium]|uniref:ATP-binding protein n=1 Tax=Arcanobacterium pluranimalium TaxID=108028 RepID=UPI001956C8B3|nr:ATP-binding protein [Arcanobacterium pluranimalium]MBM7824313.1 two-component system sensor histidine kinase KdpD [Arcanobacterium pluranimalium]
MVERGRLKVYLGFAPGVGKTYTMLREAHEVSARGTKVIVGVVEDHGRPHTKALIDGLTVMPRKEIRIGQSTFGELDVDACIAAAPEVVLVDELAHTVVVSPKAPKTTTAAVTNTSMSKSTSATTASAVAPDPTTTASAPSPATEATQTKRWHDVERLLDAGIDVVSTLNVQHIESLNDVVAAVTGTRQRETVPDHVLRNADEIELIDLTPDALRIRLSKGDIYRAEQIEAALSNYFRLGNLSALRELALLWLADRVDEGLAKYRAAKEITDNWPARERLIVAVRGLPGDETLIRRGARIIGRIPEGEMIVVHVASGDGIRLANSDHLERLQELTESLGAQWRLIVGDDVAATLVDFARSVNASQLVVGLSRRAVGFVGGLTSKRLIKAAKGIDVHIVSAEPAHRSTREKLIEQRYTRSTLRRAMSWLVAVVGPVVLAGLVSLWNPSEEYLSTILLSNLTVVVFTTLLGGLWPGIVSVLLVSFLVNWFYTPPVHTLTITEPVNIAQIVLFFVIASAVAWVVDIADRRAALAARAQRRATLLADLASGVISGGDDLRGLLERLRETFTLEAVDLQRYDKRYNRWITVASSNRARIGSQNCGVDSSSNPEQETALEKPIVSEASASQTKITIDDTMRFVTQGRALTAEDIEIIEAHGPRIVIILDRQEIDAMRRATAALEAGNRVGSAVLAAVSHDLRTPLAAIKAAASTLALDDIQLSNEDQRELIESLCASTDNLDIVVGNLLDMSRLNSNAVRIHRVAIDVGDVVDAMLRELNDAAAWIDVDLPEDLPLVEGDPGLIQRVLANLVNNCRRHAPDSRIRIVAGAVWDTVEVRIVDHGPGIPREKWDDLFTPFHNISDRQAGLGLGLAVAHGFAQEMGGDLTIEETPCGGATFVLSLRVAKDTGFKAAKENEHGKNIGC